MKKYFFTILIIFGFYFAWYYYSNESQLIELDLPEPIEHQDFVEDIAEDIDAEDFGIIEEEILLAEEELEEIEPIEEKSLGINLAVPFTPQAPSANWEQPFQDACEEASFLMVDYYYQNKEMPSVSDTEDILSEMVIWQEENWGDHYNLPVAKLAEYIEAFYPYTTEVAEDVSIEDIEGFLDKGLPVIVPADGRKLDNPFFRGEGPEYHMLVIKGYLDEHFISNDPGTRRGEDFVYTYQNMMDSIFDWDTKKSSTTGPKNVLILYKN